jgi:two-component system sensor histidine kinase YesM
MEINEKDEITGMLNIHRRLQLMFSHDSGLYIERGELGGLRVVIKITIKDQGNHNVQAIDC